MACRSTPLWLATARRMLLSVPIRTDLWAGIATRCEVGSCVCRMMWLPTWIDFNVSPMAAESGDKFVAAQVARNLHPSASISSRTR
jgi:hypothetical protein